MLTYTITLRASATLIKRLRKMSQNSIKNFADLQIAFLCVSHIWFYAHIMSSRLLVRMNRKQCEQTFYNSLTVTPFEMFLERKCIIVKRLKS